MESIKAANLFAVTGMVFVITGGGSGLGEMMALALDMNGAAKVFILGRRKESLEKVAAKSTNKTIIPIVCDVSSKDSLAAVAARIGENTPFVNVVIANAGVTGPITAVAPRPAETTVSEIQTQLWEASFEDFKNTVDINVVGSFNTFLAFLNLLDLGNKHVDSPGKDGLLTSQFITTTSFGGLSRGENVSHIYGASKAGLIQLTKMLATGFAKYGIRANSIAPGLYITEMTEFFADGKDLRAPGSMPGEFIPATRTGTEEDMAGAILFLASRAGSFVNGNVLISDGGMLSIGPGSY